MTPELRELLELSAKAMGYEIVSSSGPLLNDCIAVRHAGVTDSYFYWRPHIDKAQCFDMECALGISLMHERGSIEVLSYSVGADILVISVRELLADHNNDRAKARMMASLRVAAEIVRRMHG